jgi:nucleoside-diphosphate-sugar epimerase
LVGGIVKVIGNKNSRNQIFNLTYGDSRSLKDMADIIEDHFPDVNVRYIPKDKLTPDRGTLSVEKAIKLIGYDPQWPLEKGYVKYINCYKQMQRESSKSQIETLATKNTTKSVPSPLSL